MYRGVFEIFARYWHAYGGWHALRCSPYFHAAVALLVLTHHLWLNTAWWEIVIGALPNLLGFTLAGFAIFIGFGDERFRSLLAEPDEAGNQPTVFVSLCATFVHFIVIQIIALIYAVVAKSWWFYAEWMDAFRGVLPWANGAAGALGFGLFLYALTSVLAATMHVFRIASMYATYQRHISPRSSVVTGRGTPANN